MSEFIDDYRAAVRKRLRSRGAKRLDPSEGDKAAETLFLPSFHPEVILQAEKSDTTTLRLTTLSASLWYFSEASGSGPTPQRITEKAELDESSAAALWNQLEELEPMAIGNADSFGLDGMPVESAYCTTEAVHSFAAWSPSADSQQGRFAITLYKSAWEAFSDSKSIERLEQLHGYLHLGLPYRFLNESPRRLRLFGRLSSQDECQLRELFASVPDGESLIVDMRNFDGMGTLLYPLFVEFAKRGNRQAWVGPPQAPSYLAEVGIPESAICNSIDEARHKTGVN